MAELMANIRGTNNAFEYETALSADTTEEVSGAIFMPSNVATVAMGIKRTSGTGGYKVQVTYSTRDNVDTGNGVWFDWDIPGVASVTAYLDQDEIQWWIPIPSHIRFVVEGTSPATEVNFAMRAN